MHRFLKMAVHRHLNDQVRDEGISVMTTTALSFQLGSGGERGYSIYTVTADTVVREFYTLIP